MTTNPPAPDPESFWIVTTTDKDILALTPGLAVNLTDFWAIFLTEDNIIDTILPREQIHHMKLVREDPPPANVTSITNAHPLPHPGGTGRHR